MDNKKIKQTLVLIKPDALKNSLTGYVLSQLSEFHTGLRFAGTKIVNVSRMLAEEHYAEHRGKVFFPSLLDYIMGRIHYPDEPWKHRVIAIVYQGPDAIKKIRDIAGPTNPHIARDEKPGCIRALGTVVPLKDAEGNVIGERMDNLIHASATDSEAEREIKLWFKPNDIPPLMHAYPTEVSDAYYYHKDNKLYVTHEIGSTCFLVPGNVAWKSDLETLRLLQQGIPAPCSLQTVVVKYLINEKGETR
ncbi:MAG: nucleoside-diphosphate kinase [Nitrospirae bacterium]|nr:nucleoside-diphosphate kinase [Nitrospirota bacterium]